MSAKNTESGQADKVVKAILCFSFGTLKLGVLI